MTSAEIAALTWMRLPGHFTNHGHLRAAGAATSETLCGYSIPSGDGGEDDVFDAFDPPRYLCRLCLMLAMKEEETAA